MAGTTGGCWMHTYKKSAPATARLPSRPPGTMRPIADRESDAVIGWWLAIATLSLKGSISTDFASELDNSILPTMIEAAVRNPSACFADSITSNSHSMLNAVASFANSPVVNGITSILATDATWADFSESLDTDTKDALLREVVRCLELAGLPTAPKGTSMTLKAIALSGTLLTLRSVGDLFNQNELN